MRYELNGTIRLIKDTNVISDRFKKREFVVMIDEESQFPQPILCQFTQDRCANLDGYTAGDKVRVEFYLKGREWTSPQGEVKYFVSVDAWTIKKAGESSGGVGGAPADSHLPDAPLPPAPAPFTDSDNEDDDLPF